MSTLDADLSAIAHQEQRLVFDRFDQATAWDIGSRLKQAAEAGGGAVAIEIRLAGQTLFFYAMPGTTPANADWARRKRNVVDLQQQSSYAVGLKLARDGQTLESKLGLPVRDYATHGGSFPLRLHGAGCVGSITVSGLPQRDDHHLIVTVLADYLGVPAAEVAMEMEG